MNIKFLICLTLILFFPTAFAMRCARIRPPVVLGNRLMLLPKRIYATNSIVDKLNKQESEAYQSYIAQQDITREKKAALVRCSADGCWQQCDALNNCWREYKNSKDSADKKKKRYKQLVKEGIELQDITKYPLLQSQLKKGCVFFDSEGR